MMMERHLEYAFGLCLLLIHHTASQIEGGGEVSGCYGDTIEITCPIGQRINILGDFYGLASDTSKCSYSETDICVVPTYGHTSDTKQVCNGRTTCVFTVAEKRACIDGEEQTNYQQIKFECIKESLQNNVCVDAEWASNRGYLATPNYPMYYPENVDCRCTLKTMSDATLTLKTLEFRINYRSPCRDYLHIEANGQQDVELCGSVHRLYRGKQIQLTFHSERNAFKGFLLAYEGFGQAQVKVQCSMLDRNPDGTYNTSVLSSSSSSSSSSSFSSSSSVSVKDGKHSESTKMKFTVHHKDQLEKSGVYGRQVESHDHNAHATSGGERRAFPGGRASSVSGSLKGAVSVSASEASVGEVKAEGGRSPVVVRRARVETAPKRHVAAGCFGDLIHFQCGDGYLIRIVDDMYGAGEAGQCGHRDGDCVVHPSGGASIVTQLCSSRTRCRNLIVTRLFCGEHVTSYQQITYECVPETEIFNICSSLVMTSQLGYVSSPRFPEPYPPNVDCSCRLRADDSRLILSIAHFSLHLATPCADWLNIEVRGTSSRRRLCGNQHGDFSGEEITLIFHTDSLGTRNGFWFGFEGVNGSDVHVRCNVPDHFPLSEKTSQVTEPSPFSKSSTRKRPETFARVTSAPKAAPTSSSTRPPFVNTLTTEKTTPPLILSGNVEFMTVATETVDIPREIITHPGFIDIFDETETVTHTETTTQMSTPAPRPTTEYTFSFQTETSEPTLRIEPGDRYDENHELESAFSPVTEDLNLFRLGDESSFFAEEDTGALFEDSFDDDLFPPTTPRDVMKSTTTPSLMIFASRAKTTTRGHQGGFIEIGSDISQTTRKSQHTTTTSTTKATTKTTTRGTTTSITTTTTSPTATPHGVLTTTVVPNIQGQSKTLNAGASAVGIQNCLVGAIIAASMIILILDVHLVM